MCGGLSFSLLSDNILYGFASTGSTSLGIIQKIGKTEIELIDIKNIVIQNFDINKIIIEIIPLLYESIIASQEVQKWIHIS